MDKPPYNVLFLCASNSARSQMAEVLLNHMGTGRFQAFSAGSRPAGRLQPLAAQLITEHGFAAEPLRSKSWDEFTTSAAPTMDLVITLCDVLAGEACPVWPGHPAIAHWGIPDPARTPSDLQAFRQAWVALRRRIDLLLALPLNKLDRLAREQHLTDIHAQADG